MQFPMLSHLCRQGLSKNRHVWPGVCSGAFPTGHRDDDLANTSTTVPSINVSTYPSRPVQLEVSVMGKPIFCQFLVKQSLRRNCRSLKSLVRRWATEHHQTDVSPPNHDTNNVVPAENNGGDDVPSPNGVYNGVPPTEDVVVIDGVDGGLAPNEDGLKNSPGL